MNFSFLVTPNMVTTIFKMGCVFLLMSVPILYGVEEAWIEVAYVSLVAVALGAYHYLKVTRMGRTSETFMMFGGFCIIGCIIMLLRAVSGDLYRASDWLALVFALVSTSLVILVLVKTRRFVERAQQAYHEAQREEQISIQAEAIRRANLE